MPSTLIHSTSVTVAILPTSKSANAFNAMPNPNTAVPSATNRAARESPFGRSISTSTPKNERYMVQASIDLRFSSPILRAESAPQDSPGQRPGKQVPKTDSSPERAVQNYSHT